MRRRSSCAWAKNSFNVGSHPRKSRLAGTGKRVSHWGCRGAGLRLALVQIIQTDGLGPDCTSCCRHHRNSGLGEESVGGGPRDHIRTTRVFWLRSGRLRRENPVSRQADRPCPVHSPRERRPFGARRCYSFSMRGVAQPGSALVWGTSGRRFKSSRPDQTRIELGPEQRSGPLFCSYYSQTYSQMHEVGPDRAMLSGASPPVTPACAPPGGLRSHTSGRRSAASQAAQ